MKTLLNAFFDAKDIIHQEFLPEKQTVNGRFYKEMIKRLINQIHCVLIRIIYIYRNQEF
jgi:hypothetical protein